jgi:hypothetical protein
VICIKGKSGRTVWESEGRMLPAFLRPGQAILEVTRDGVTAQVDLTNLLMAVPCRWQYTYPTPVAGIDLADPDSPVAVDLPPDPVRTEIILDMEDATAESLRHSLERSFPASFRPDLAEDESRRLRDGYWGTVRDLLRIEPEPRRSAEPTAAEVDRIVSLYGDDPDEAQRLYERGMMPPEDVRILTGFAQSCMDAADAFRRMAPGPVQAYDDLIASTRAEFPHDPYGYGRIHPQGPSRWTPPEDPDEEVPSCPA